MAPPGRGGLPWVLRGGQAGSSHGRHGQKHNGDRGKNICRNLQAGYCKFGARCRYSHEVTDVDEQEPWTIARERRGEDSEERQARMDYNAWKRLIKTRPIRNDVVTIKRVWTDALKILNETDRDRKQMLPRDLDDDTYYGREHIDATMSMMANPQNRREFVDLAKSFILVITHPALVDCLSIDTFVGNLYNYVGGSHGNRAISFLKHMCTNLAEVQLASWSSMTLSDVEKTIIAMLTVICQLLRREHRATFHDELPDLVNSLENIIEITGVDKSSTAHMLIIRQITELRDMIARAKGLLAMEDPQKFDKSTAVVNSTYPREIIIPKDRHDNDKMDITKIKLLPTQDEIRSNHLEFLPSIDRDQPHFLSNPVERYIDTQFRLLRYDIFAELKEVLGGLMVAMEEDVNLLSNPKLSLGNIRAYPYPKAFISRVSYHHRLGLQVQISFAQLSVLRKKSRAERRTWWEDSKRLDEGVLLCFVALTSGRSSVSFFTVSQKSTDPRKDYNLVSHDHQSTIIAKLATYNQENMDTLLRFSSQSTKGILFEFPSVLLGTFIPVLETLQDMQQQSRLPFRQWILPDRMETNKGVSVILDVPPPAYARSPGFTFSLNKILKNAGDSFSLSPSIATDDAATINELEKRTSLDRGQCQALMAALFREFAFIQGPPGTGKTYLGVHLMRVLLSCKDKANLGPIIVVCDTNHALDQFLEHLIEIGITKIIRIGGQSKSTIVEGKNLRLVSKVETKTKSEGYLLAQTYKELEASEEYISKQLGYFHSAQKRLGWESVRRHLASEHPQIHNQFATVDGSGFKTVGKEPFDVWAYGRRATQSESSHETGDQPTIQELLLNARQDVNSLLWQDRRRLIEYWMGEMREVGIDEVFESVREADRHRKQLSDIHDEVDRRVLETADVIGVTTTGLAKRIAVLKHVICKVVICEEAGEVMEPHMLSALLPHVEHFIQIGDHQQLRPQINNYGLSLESSQGLAYQLDRSMFERLSIGERGRPKLPLAQLNIQRRMRPEISKFIRETIYPRLIDHSSTQNLPNVVGLRKNVFWLDHDNGEGANADPHQKSYSNLWEVDFTHALVRHIVRQGAYKSSDMAVLTPYTGQLQKLRAKMRSDFEIVLSERDEDLLVKDGLNEEEAAMGSQQSDTQWNSSKKPLEKKKLSDLLRISTCDNFQGEESQIIIVSLVRSNKQKKVGFLKTKNRINVLLSRAKHGMYLIGNKETYSNVPMWSKVLGMLEATDSVGETLELCCPRHPETEIQVRQPKDFTRLSPEGGCQLICDQRLSACGHRCEARCHAESIHLVFPCPRPCQRLHSPCNHSCQKVTCGEDCGPCMVKMHNVQLPCEHSKENVPCHLGQDISKIMCDVVVEKQVPGCGHAIKVQCWRGVASKTFDCPAPCMTNLPCGHTCPGSCGRCNLKKVDEVFLRSVYPSGHQICATICGRRHGTCHHTCRRLCHDGTSCGSCPLKCEVKCEHSRCTLRCHEACAPCVEPCTWSCEHRGSCDMPCAAPCVRLPCNLRCSKELSCGHQCPGICGEICPEGYCHMCGSKGDSRVDFLEMKSYNEINVEDTPIVVLGCGHFFTAETLDGHVGIEDVYSIDENGEYTGLKYSSQLARSIPRCPDCQCPIRQYVTQRYNRVINGAVIDEMSKRFLVDGQDRLQVLEHQIDDLERRLENTRKYIIHSFQPTSMFGAVPSVSKIDDVKYNLRKRYEESLTLQKAIYLFCKGVADTQQPARKLHNAIVNAGRSDSVSGSRVALDINAIFTLQRDRQITIGGRLAQMKADYVLIADIFGLHKVSKLSNVAAAVRIPGGKPNQLAGLFFETCKELITECAEENFRKQSVQATICYANLARLYESYCRSEKTGVENISEYVTIAKELLETAKTTCAHEFENANGLLEAVKELMKLLGKEWYEELTEDELAAIKTAMVSGPNGIATHSGHWYNCENGHPFAIGDCGMPMEKARCTECGALIGGQQHQAVAGVTRATQMED